MDEKSAARSRFDRWASNYERDRLSRWIAGAQREALAALELLPQDRMLDIGCGTGAAVRDAAEACASVTGVDLSEAMIARARELAAGIPNASFRQGDSEHLPLEDGSFTAVLCTTSLHHYPDPGRAVAEMARVLVPGGRLVIGDGNADSLVVRLANRVLPLFEHSHIRFHRPSELARILAHAGFTGLEKRSIWAGGYLLLRARRM